tara:strand:+ start:43 stop:291 length:249 start_codon:yes stop_codon:yes gene_type:complete
MSPCALDMSNPPGKEVYPFLCVRLNEKDFDVSILSLVNAKSSSMESISFSSLFSLQPVNIKAEIIRITKNFLISNPLCFNNI